MPVVWEFARLQWCYSINGCVSASTYPTQIHAETASRKPQHYYRHSNRVRPVHDWPRLWGFF